MTLAEVKFNDRYWDSGYYTFSSDRFLVFSTDHSKAMLLLWIFLLFMFCVYHVFMSVNCSLGVTCWERIGLCTLLYVMFSCVLSLSHIVSWVRCGA